MFDAHKGERRTDDPQVRHRGAHRRRVGRDQRDDRPSEGEECHGQRKHHQSCSPRCVSRRFASLLGIARPEPLPHGRRRGRPKALGDRIRQGLDAVAEAQRCQVGAAEAAQKSAQDHVDDREQQASEGNRQPDAHDLGHDLPIGRSPLERHILLLQHPEGNYARYQSAQVRRMGRPSHAHSRNAEPTPHEDGVQHEVQRHANGVHDENGPQLRDALKARGQHAARREGERAPDQAPQVFAPRCEHLAVRRHTQQLEVHRYQRRQTEREEAADEREPEPLDHSFPHAIPAAVALARRRD
mmetsp:Transcript_25348/g.72325  ORF Transcript_25348/g.72325 Transcript_25348/m.72325 type:complete len:298 (-) Transcript_25348:629-1522(-)